MISTHARPLLWQTVRKEPQICGRSWKKSPEAWSFAAACLNCVREGTARADLRFRSAWRSSWARSRRSSRGCSFNPRERREGEKTRIRIRRRRREREREEDTRQTINTRIKEEEELMTIKIHPHPNGFICLFHQENKTFFWQETMARRSLLGMLKHICLTLGRLHEIFIRYWVSAWISESVVFYNIIVCYEWIIIITVGFSHSQRPSYRKIF